MRFGVVPFIRLLWPVNLFFPFFKKNMLYPSDHYICQSVVFSRYTSFPPPIKLTVLKNYWKKQKQESFPLSPREFSLLFILLPFHNVYSTLIRYQEISTYILDEWSKEFVSRYTSFPPPIKLTATIITEILLKVALNTIKPFLVHTSTYLLLKLISTLQNSTIYFYTVNSF
jgi:hypothetical protein